MIPHLIHFNYIFKFILVFFLLQALISQWDKDAESTRSNHQTSLSETQNSLNATQTELASTHKALTEVQAALSQTQSELRESWAKLDELQTSSKEESQKLEEELKQAWADRDAAARELHPSTILSASSLHSDPLNSLF